MQKNKARVTVILPTFNRAAYLAASLESVLHQRLAPAQVIVVNDGSTDDTEAVLEPFRPRIAYIAQRNAGKPAAINAAMPHVVGDYIWVFDDDDIACEDALERHITTLEQHPQAGFTFGHSYHCSSHPETGMLCIRHERRIPPFAPDDDFFHLLLSSYVASPAVVVRTAVQLQAGPYQEDLDRSEDWEIALRWGLIAPAIRTIGSTPTYFRRFHDGLRGPAGRQFNYAENMPRSRVAERGILRRHAENITLDRYLPRPLWGQPLDGEHLQRALLRRLTVLMRKGMWREAAADLSRLQRAGFSPESLREEQEQLAWRAFTDVHSVHDLAGSSSVAELRDRLKGPEFELLRHVWGERLYRHLRNRLARDGLPSALRVAAAYQNLLGISGTTEQLLRRAASKVRRVPRRA